MGQSTCWGQSKTYTQFGDHKTCLDAAAETAEDNVEINVSSRIRAQPTIDKVISTMMILTAFIFMIAICIYCLSNNKKIKLMNDKSEIAPLIKNSDNIQQTN